MVCFQGRTILEKSFCNPAWLVGLPDFYPILLCGPYLQGVHTSSGAAVLSELHQMIPSTCYLEGEILGRLL